MKEWKIFDSSFNRHIIPGIKEFVLGSPNPELIRALKLGTTPDTLKNAIKETIEAESLGSLDQVGYSNISDDSARQISGLITNWYPYAPRVLSNAEGAFGDQSLRGFQLLGLGPRPPKEEPDFDLNKLIDLLRQDPSGFRVIDYVVSSPQAREARMNLRYPSSINNLIDLGGQRYKKFYEAVNSFLFNGHDMP